MDGGSEDEDWVEAELERQLAADDDYDSHAEDDAEVVPELPLNNRAAAGEESERMAQFRELVAQMEQWGEAMARNVEETLLETAVAASNAERELQERPPPPELPHVEPDAPNTELSALDLEFLPEEWEDPAGNSEPNGTPEEDALSFLAQLATQARAAALQEFAASQVAEANPEDDTSVTQGAAGAATVEVSSHAILDLPEAGDMESFEAIERRIEEERLACLKALEKQQEELVQEMRREEEQRREEEACLREQVQMHTQELQCREFYQEERRNERREQRRMTLADKENRHVREEEHRVKENAERAQEAFERLRLEVEDNISAAVRRREHEKREGHNMCREDGFSETWRQKLRLEFELRRFGEADVESHRWQEKVKQVEEQRRMSLADEDSRLQQLCQHVELSKAKEMERRTEALQPPIVAPCTVDLSVLSKMMIPLSPKGEVKASSPKGELNPWEQAPRSTRRASKNAEVNTCGNAICMKLYEGTRKKRGRRRSVNTTLACRPPKVTTTVSAAFSSVSAADLGLELAGGLDDLLGPTAMTPLVRLEVRMEGLESLPILSRLPQLRALVLSGNKINGSLEALKHCPHLEELDLCQNSLTSLDGLRHLKYLSVLKATMNEISDAEDLAHLSMLRVVDLSKNRLTTVPLNAPVLAKLNLYRNSIDSANCLRQLPGLTQLDLGRNKLTELDDISEWTPLLMKVFLYENRLVSLPELHLPLLTDLWVDNNQLAVLGPLGFLPSLERLQAKHNCIRSLAQPIAACPLLKTLELAFNQLDATDIPKAVMPLQRLSRLQLNDNPLVTELMEEYRPWILSFSPHLEELDNETVCEVERRTLELPSSLGMGRAIARAALPVEGVARPTHGLLSLVAPKAARVERSETDCQGATAGVDAPPQDSKEVLLERWKAAWSGPGPNAAGGCPMCALACWCEALNAARSVPLVAHTREERRTAVLLSNATKRRHDEATFALRRRHDFWNAFLQLCGVHFDSFTPWPKQGLASVSRSPTFELPIPGAERSCQELLRKVQSRWRGILARRRVATLRLDQVCQALSQSQQKRFVQLQALWRGQRSRQDLRRAGYVLCGDRRLAAYGRAATQLQAALRGSRLRQKLRWAKEVSKMTSDDMEDCPAVDLEQLLNDARRVAEADPFGYLSLPQGVVLKPTPLPVPQSQPIAAWGTPPSTAAGERKDGEGSRRCRSLSSTAESAMTEDRGTRTGTRVEQAKEEWGFKDMSTARNYLKAQKRRQAKPPTLPTGSSSRSGNLHGLNRKSTGSSSSRSASRPGEGCQSAQAAIEEYRRQQEAEQENQARSSGSFSEFRSGSPNRKLMRSSKSLSEKG